MGYYAGKPIKSVVFCFYKITLNVSIFYVFTGDFTGTINDRFLTNQSARSVLVFYKLLDDFLWPKETIF